MSRLYNVVIGIKDYNINNFDEIEMATRKCQPGSFLWWEDDQTDDNLYLHRESEKQFAERLTKAIWRANKAFCKVEITMTCLEETPCETYELDEEYYNTLNALPKELKDFIEGK